MSKQFEDRALRRSKSIFTGIQTPFAAASAFAFYVGTSFAQTAMPTIEEIPVFDDSALFTQSDALAVSGDGSVAVGNATNAAGDPRAFRFSGGTLTNLTPLAGTVESFATGANQDGTVISGYQFDAGEFTAFYWTQATGTVLIPSIAGIFSEANGTNADGSVIVGTLLGDGVSPNPPDISSPAPYDRAFVWTRATNSIVAVPSLELFGETRGNDISDDGTIVVGRAETGGSNHAFRAIVGGAIADLGTIGSVAGFSEANGVSGDGLVVVGLSNTPTAAGRRAFRWSTGTGMVQLNSTDEANVVFSTANAASQDGSYVAGAARYTTTPGFRALRWDSAGVATDLGDLTSDNSGTSFANGISADGSVVVGVASNDDGDSRGFIWRDAVKPSGTMIDHVNTLIQVSENAAQQAAGAAQLDKLVQFAMGQTLEMPISGDPGSRNKARTTRPYSLKAVAGASNNPDANNTSIAGLIGAVAINDNLVLGGHVGIGGDSDSLAGFGIDGTFQTYGIYLQGGHPRTEGLNWKVAAAQSSANVDITRSTALANTERGTGNTDMSAGAASAELGYGISRGASLITPLLRVARSSVKRDGYSETDAVAFPVTYNAYEIDATVATLGADYRMPVSNNGRIKLTAGLEFDLSRSDSSVTGSSAIPGMTTFAIAGPTLEHEQRLFAEAHYTHDLSGGRSYDLGLGVHQTAYSDKPSLMASIGYQMDF
ncbi:autotransporter domain-containing protein [Aliiroseovarius sp. 2305UL8-7]|uniref:autotransporter domain-containing protein n=1 Tax=Aliiroseovarius conchicola TaxID=3121637 RepID=UPI0035272B96